MNTCELYLNRNNGHNDEDAGPTPQSSEDEHFCLEAHSSDRSGDVYSAVWLWFLVSLSLLWVFF